MKIGNLLFKVDQRSAQNIYPSKIFRYTVCIDQPTRVDNDQRYHYSTTQLIN